MTSGEISQTIGRIFKEGAKRPFLWAEDLPKGMSYDGFSACVTELRARLAARDLKAGDRVCVILPNSWQFLALYLAAASLKIVLVPVDPLRGEAEIRDILSLSPCRMVLAQDDAAGLFDGMQKRAASEPWWEGLDGNELFLISFSSGTTGVPKGIRHSFKNLFLSAQAFAQRFDFGPGNIFYHNLSMSYMAGILNLFIMPLVCGCGIVVGERFTGARILSFWELPVKYKADTFWFIPTIAAMLLKMDRGALGIDHARAMKITALIGTAPLSEQLKDDFEKKYNFRLYESYGLSETLFLTTNSPKDKAGEKSVGKPLQGVEVSFHDDGEIAVKTPWTFFGYVGQEAAAGPQGWFATGDLGEMTSAGALKITGRKKDIIIRGGVNISPRRIEEFLMKEAMVDEAVVVGIKDQILGEKTVGVVVLKAAGNGRQMDKASLNARIASQLGRDYSVDDYKVLESIPKNANGKTDRKKLISMIEGAV